MTIKRGDTLYSIFKKLHISTTTLAEILQLPKASWPLRHLHLNQNLRFSVDSKNNLLSLALVEDKSHVLVIFKAGSKYVARVERAVLRGPAELKAKPISSASRTNVVHKPVVSNAAKPTLISKPLPKTSTVVKTTATTTSTISPQTSTTTIEPKPTYLGLHYTGFTIHKSLYNDGENQGIPYSILMQLVKIFALQINFKDIRPGDKVVLAYDNAKGEKGVPGNIIAAKITRGTRVYAAIRYVNAQGVAEYLNPNGEGMTKAFNRFPVKYTHINSLFNMHRIHPVTHVPRPHNGLDLAAPLGSPVSSIGEGKIVFIGWSGAYGNLIKIQHNGKYSSQYAHLLRFAPGLHIGSYVHRGQLIGFLGQTGNATGPHVHFEIRINNVPVNPLTVPLPYASSINGAQATAFQSKAKQLMIELNSYQKTYLK